jgi:hypothetical protein
MNNKKITELLSTHPKTSKMFKGVYAADTLPTPPKKIKTPHAYVANTDPSFKPGSHWVCFFFDTHGAAEYMDSYGIAPNKVFECFLGNPYKYNKEFLQFPFSTACGQYVIFYLLHRCQGESMESILSKFSLDDKISNDKMVNRSVEHNFHVDLDIFDTNYINKQICRSYDCL